MARENWRHCGGCAEVLQGDLRGLPHDRPARMAGASKAKAAKDGSKAPERGLKIGGFAMEIG